MTPDTSSSGGYLAPTPAPAPLEGDALLAFLQGWIVGISGLPGNMVRPRWQTEPPSIPQAGNCWAALGVQRRPSDEYPYNAWNPGASAFVLWRQEMLAILASFYDTGVGGQADYFAALFRDGTAIPQNREALTLAGFGLVRCGDLVTVPSLLKLRWLYRVDLEIVVRRQITREYPVETLVAASGDIYTDGGYPPQPFQAGTPSPAPPPPAPPAFLVSEDGDPLVAED